MPYSENASVSSLGVIDYNDLDMTLTRNTSPSKQNMDNFKFSLKSIDESELDDFRRSLVTPMSVNNVQDPMYAEFEKSRDFHKKYILPNTSKRSTTLSPTLSYAGSVADSLAVFNRFIDDHSSDDFVRGDFNDFMSPYNMDDLISLPQTPSPQIGRVTVARCDSLASIGNKDTKNTTANNNTYLKPRKVSIDACVQTPSCFDDTKPVSPNRSSSKERYGNLKNPKQEPIKTLQPKQTDKRRWSSYVPEKPIITSKLAQLSNRNRLSTVNKTYTTTAEMNKKDSNVTQMNRAPLLSDVKSKPETKRNLTTGVYSDDRNSLRKNSKEELTPVQITTARHEHNTTTDTSHHSDQTDSNVYLERRLSLMTNSDEQRTSVVKEQPQRREIPISRYSYRQLSTRTKADDTTKPAKYIAQIPTKTDQRGGMFISRSKLIDTKPVKETASKYTKSEQPQRSIYSSRSRVVIPTEPKPVKDVLKPIKSEQPQRSIFSSRSRAAAAAEPKDIKDASATERPERSIFNSRRHLIHRADNVNDLVSSQVHDINLNKGHVDQHKHGSSDTPRRVSYRDHNLSYGEPTTTTDESSRSASKRLSSSALLTSSVPAASSIPAPSTPRAAPTISTQLRRARSLTVPSSRYGYRESDANGSSMPVPIFRHRKQTSKYASVPEDKVAPPPPPAPAPVTASKEVRLSFSNRRSSNNDIQPVASDSTSGYSNTTTSSSRSDDIDSTPSTPPGYCIDTRFERRKSIPLKEDRGKGSSGGYLNKTRDMYDPSSYRRQRVVSEDNNQYKDQQRKCVTESAREVLAHVQERRAKNAIILNNIQYK
ncbi:hypothetical protein BDF21DRAFT_451627 [Thamnidium elegans]|nr:hypothetical protein BDF21DRAFT_451627 [Thamnidium elegans]